jgi:hypothetical protein
MTSGADPYLLHIPASTSCHRKRAITKQEGLPMLPIALIASALLLVWFASQLRGRSEEPALSDVKHVSGVSPAGAMRTVSATTTAHGPEVVALVLRVQNVDCACENARKFADKTFRVADAPKLPFKDCGRVDCRCRYERIANRRKANGERRINANRREEIRFEMKDDRRSGKDRRQTNNVWKQPV